ncbi:hypothetical protein O181_063565 [Austropuccinia psidii MF-1]|uniref:Uncharacterized protein n=1 Tax=Austropuccinia psidii MF-1 TaxID=1389203 RepID=A0A9Q3ERI2_9BASI|nr:hypothetical protein [Austropuccinia psidii MF-1]
MPELQRTDSGTTEGENSVSSVSLELFSQDMEAKESRESDMHIKFLNYGKVLGPCSIMAPSRSSIWANKPGWTLLQILGRSLFMVLNCSQKFQAIWANLAIITIIGPWEPIQNWAPGDSNIAHVLQIMGLGP